MTQNQKFFGGVAMIAVGVAAIIYGLNEKKPSKKEIEETRGGSDPITFAGGLFAVTGLVVAYKNF